MGCNSRRATARMRGYSHGGAPAGNARKLRGLCLRTRTTRWYRGAACCRARVDSSRPRRFQPRRRRLQRVPSVKAPAAPSKPRPDITGRLARYMVEARDRSLPPDVAREGKHRILDTLAAMVSGARLKPGEMAIRYVRAQGGVPEASVLTTEHQDLRGQRRAGQRDVRPRRRNGRLRAGNQGASRLRRRSRRAGHGGARGPIGDGAAQGRHARLRSLLPLSHGARTGPRARDAPQRGGHQRHVRRRGGRGLVGPPG